jgi:hypothetical protein
MSPLPDSGFCLAILADADPVVLVRLIERIQSLGLVSRRLSAQWLSDDRLSIELVCTGLDEPRVEILTQRISQFTTVHSATWRRIPDPPMSD